MSTPGLIVADCSLGVGMAPAVPDPPVFALAIGKQESHLPGHLHLADALLRAVGEVQLGETVVVLQVNTLANGRLSFVSLATVSPYRPEAAS